MAGLTPASPTAEPAPRRRSSEARLFSPARGVAALSPPPARRGERVVLLFMVLAVVLGPLHLARGDQRHRLHRAAPGAVVDHPFGTDDLGQDVLARMLYGGRISLAVGLAAMLVAVICRHAGRRVGRHVARQRRGMR